MVNVAMIPLVTAMLSLLILFRKQDVFKRAGTTVDELNRKLESPSRWESMGLSALPTRFALFESNQPPDQPLSDRPSPSVAASSVDPWSGDCSPSRL